MRHLQSRNRSLIRYTAFDDGLAGPDRPPVKPCVKYAVVLISTALIAACALTYLVTTRPTAVKESGVSIKADASNSTRVSTDSCQIDDDLKVNCGHPGITYEHCLRRLCCYAESETPGIPWCFVSKERMDPQCTVPRQDKVNCGFRGISKHRCEAKGCCYANAGAERIPWCFQKPGKDLPEPKRASATECIVPGEEKVECGFTGITESQCMRKGCCYDPTGTLGEPFCYQKWQIITGSDAEEAEKCGVLEHDRKECGFDGIPPEQCWRRGCCYERTGHENVPFCFHATHRTYHKGDRVVAEECAVPDGERFDCGFPGVQPHQCRAKGCCYAPAETTGAPFCFWKSPIEAGQPMRQSNSTVLPADQHGVEELPTSLVVRCLLVLAGVATCLGACLICMRQPPSKESTELDLVTRCTPLESSSEIYRNIQDHFLASWNAKRWSACSEEVPAPSISAIYEVENEAHLSAYEAKQLELTPEAAKLEDGAKPGNEKRCFFGARKICAFDGQLCSYDACTVCRIVRQGHFGTCGGGGATGSMSFSRWAHTAKGRGLAPGQQPPPADFKDFVSAKAGNAVFVADVLVGNADHSRVIDSSTGSDEILVSHVAQATPRALIIFGD